MNISPKLLQRPAGAVEPGSLVLIPQLEKWGISAGKQGVFLLGQTLHAQPTEWTKHVLDAGVDYLVSIQDKTPMTIAHPWTVSLRSAREPITEPAKDGLLCLFAGAEPCVSIGVPEGRGVLLVLEIPSGAVRERTSDGGEGQCFRHWRLGIPHVESERGYLWVFEQYGRQRTT